MPNNSDPVVQHHYRDFSAPKPSQWRNNDPPEDFCLRTSAVRGTYKSWFHKQNLLLATNIHNDSPPLGGTIAKSSAGSKRLVKFVNEYKTT
mmetsp:Transcript_51967/g.70903  ORF Transcript_51967/g.70903 Transcript_51967/m.70903 type:complete len:91 (+) Transcript_51967:141-413(+)